jgi:hypothetical protein
MEFPDRDVALAWVGRTLIDRDGVEIGACTAVFSDDATQLTEWVCAELDGVAVFIPAVGAAESDRHVQVTVSRAGVASAPAVGGGQHISEEDEAALYRHYGIPHSREASPSLLPTEDAPQRTDGVGSDAASPPVEPVAAEAAFAPAVAPAPVASPPVEPVAAEAAAFAPAVAPAPVEPAAAPVVEDAGPRTESAWDAEPAGSAAPAARRRWAVPVAGGLAGVGLAVGLVLRRLRTRRPPTRTEQLAARAQAASAVVRARTGQVAASAVPLLETARQVARDRRRASAVAGAVPAAAAALTAAVRRRRSRRSAASRTADEDR